MTPSQFALWRCVRGVSWWLVIYTFWWRGNGKHRGICEDLSSYGLAKQGMFRLSGAFTRNYYRHKISEAFDKEDEDISENKSHRSSGICNIYITTMWRFSYMDGYRWMQAKYVANGFRMNLKSIRILQIIDHEDSKSGQQGGLEDEYTGDPLHSRAACTQPCNVNTHSRAHCSPGERLCEQWGHGCVNNGARLCAIARLCRGSPVSISMCRAQRSVVYWRIRWNKAMWHRHTWVHWRILKEHHSAGGLYN